MPLEDHRRRPLRPARTRGRRRRPAGAADAKATAKVTYEEHVPPIFQNRCTRCHNADKKKGGPEPRQLTAARCRAAARARSIEPGDPDGSSLWLLVTHKDEPNMPPNSPKLPDAELDVIKQWIEAGAPETAGSKVAVKAKPKVEFKLDPSAMGKPAGPPPMPENLPTEPVVVSARPNAIVALAAQPVGAARRGRRAEAGAALHGRTATCSASCPSPRGRSTS